MSGNKVEENFNSLFVCLVKKVYKVVVCSVTGGNLLVVANVIACVHKR